MRRHEKEIKDKDAIIALLNSCHVGRLATIGHDGWPIVKPLNFAYNADKIYFHTSKQGEKMDDMRRDSRVSFEVDLPIAYIKGGKNPCEASYFFKSVIIKGRARIIEDRDEKIIALNCLMEKYQPERDYGQYLSESVERVGVVAIDIINMTCKEHLGKGALREKALKAVSEGTHLPIVLQRE